LETTTDPEVRQNTLNLRAIHETIMNEIRRQTEMIQNIVQIDVEPAQRELSELLKHVEMTGSVPKSSPQPNSPYLSKQIDFKKIDLNIACQNTQCYSSLPISPMYL
jgi:hypothetical protein